MRKQKEVTVLSCPHCRSTRLTKNGFSQPSGKQIYRCKNCLKYTTAPKAKKKLV